VRKAANVLVGCCAVLAAGYFFLTSPASVRLVGGSSPELKVYVARECRDCAGKLLHVQSADDRDLTIRDVKVDNHSRGPCSGILKTGAECFFPLWNDPVKVEIVTDVGSSVFRF
jgi:hypothetical protein